MSVVPIIAKKKKLVYAKENIYSISDHHNFQDVCGFSFVAQKWHSEWSELW